MSWRELPEGVPPTNEKQDFAAPDTATPGFVYGGLDERSHRRRIHEREEEREIIIEEDDDDDDGPVIRDNGGNGDNIKFILIALGLIFIALAAYNYTQNKKRLPLCSTQPEWNQYNCLPG